MGKHNTPIDLGARNLTCTKICYSSRKVARKAARLVPGHHLRPYRCEDHWHLGHLRPDVLYGEKTADQVYAVQKGPDWAFGAKIT
jgi:hypothetical protein